VVKELRVEFQEIDTSLEGSHF